MSAKQVILTSGTNWTVPSDWNNSSNTVECIGSGSHLGGGGAYAKISNLSLTIGANVSCQLGVDSSSPSVASTWFSATSTVYAAGATSATGGAASSCVGTVTYSGGNGASATPYAGGGAAGPNGAGNNASGGVGGSGDAGHGGAGGNGANGGNGTEWGSAGSGGGGATNKTGGNYGGGGGAGGGGAGNGGNGVIVITYTPPASPISGSASLTFGGSGTLTNANSNALSGNSRLTLAASGTAHAVPKIKPISGAASLTFGGHGTLGSVKPIAGNMALAFSTHGKLSAIGVLRGAASLTFGGSGAITNANIGAHFYQLFVNVYTARQTLLNAIYAAAQADANTANAQLAAIANDNILSPGEKPVVIRDYNALIAEQAGIDEQAQSNGLSTSTYDSALSALTAYLATLTTPKAWNDKSGNTTIVGATFRANFAAVYTARQALLNSMDSAMIIANPNFLNGLSGWTNNGSGWSAQKGSTQNPYITSYAQFAAGSTNAQLFNNTGYPCQPGDSFACSAQITGVSGSGSGSAGIAFFQSNGTLAQAFWGNHISGSTSGTSRVVATAPANAVSANAAISVGNYTGAGSYQFSGVTLDAMPNSIDEVPDGTTYAKILGSDLSNGTHKIGVAGSGYTVGDQRNLNPVTWASVRSLPSAQPITFSISGTTVSFTVAAFTLIAGGVSVAYNASSGSVTQTAGTTIAYYLYYRDPTGAGGAQTLYISTNSNDLVAHSDIISLGSASVTVASGGGGSGGGGSGGGGGGYPIK